LLVVQPYGHENGCWLCRGVAFAPKHLAITDNIKTQMLRPDWDLR